MPILISLTPPSLQILGKTQGYFRFPDFWSIPYKKNCHNSRTSDDIEMKLGSVNKLDKRNKTISKKFYFDIMSSKFDFIVIFSIYGQFGAIPKPDSGRIICKSYIFINSNFLSYKNENRIKKSLIELSQYYF